MPEQTPDAAPVTVEAIDWKEVARRAAGHIDQLLLYVTFPNDSHPQEAMAFLLRANEALEIRRTPRMAQTIKPGGLDLPLPCLAATPSDRARGDREVTQCDQVVRDLQDVYGALTPDVHRHDIDGMAYAVERAIRYLQSDQERKEKDRQADQVIAGFLDEPANMHGLTSLDMPTVRAIVRKFQSAEQRALSASDEHSKAMFQEAANWQERALAAEAREREALRQREISDRTAQERRELADHNLRMAHEIEVDLRAAEQRVRALVEDAIKVVNDPPMVPPKPLETPVRYYRRRIKLGLRALLPAADGGIGKKAQ